MAKAYSNDLRLKIIEAHQEGEGSLEELADQFHLSVGWVPPHGERGAASHRALVKVAGRDGSAA